ncbi:MAG: hypothetical protein KGK30_06490, partial [Elusimicrobia bacterium]|nr:hypothetical protein [Elusimicrobiota bacterium]
MLSSLCFIVVLAAAEPPKPAAVPPAASAASAAPAAPAVVAPAPRPVPKPAAKPATKPAAKPAETPAAAAAPQAAAVDPRASAEKEFEFLSDAAARAQSTKEYRASASALDVFADAHPRADFAASALSELAAAQERLKDSTALVTWLRLIYEFPDSPQAKSGRESFLSFASDRLSRRLRPAAADIAQPAPGAGAADRLAALLERLSGPL